MINHNTQDYLKTIALGLLLKTDSSGITEKNSYDIMEAISGNILKTLEDVYEMGYQDGQRNGE